MEREVIEYYKTLYESNPKRPILKREELLNKIANIIQIILNQDGLSNKKPIWLPKSTTKDYNGISQKEIEKIIRADNRKTEIENFNQLLGKITSNENKNKLFIHQTRKTILFKKKNDIKGGNDIRVINILPAG